MAHVYDTGASAPQRTLIQRGAIALLAGLKRPTGYLASVQPWGAVLRSYTDEEGISRVIDTVKPAPAILIATGDAQMQIAGIGGYQIKGDIELLLYFVSNNARNLQIGRQEIDVVGAADDHADPGLHVMMEHARELLVGQLGDMSDSIKQVRPDREEELATANAVTVWLQTYRITIVDEAPEFRSATQLLESIHWRTATEPTEVPLPNTSTFSTTVDVFNDGLDPHT